MYCKQSTRGFGEFKSRYTGMMWPHKRTGGQISWLLFLSNPTLLLNMSQFLLHLSSASIHEFWLFFIWRFTYMWCIKADIWRTNGRCLRRRYDRNGGLIWEETGGGGIAAGWRVGRQWAEVVWADQSTQLLSPHLPPKILLLTPRLNYIVVIVFYKFV